MAEKDQHADVLKERISENEKAQKSDLDAAKRGIDQRKAQLEEQAKFAKKNIDDQVDTSKKTVDRNAAAAKAALKDSKNRVQ